MRRRRKTADGPGAGRSRLKYDDGTPVWVPAAIGAFERDPATRPSVLVRQHPARAGLRPDPPLPAHHGRAGHQAALHPQGHGHGDPGSSARRTRRRAIPRKGELGRRYSNFGHYVDRKTGEFVLLVAEEPRVTWDDYWSDCIRFRVKVRG